MRHLRLVRNTTTIDFMRYTRVWLVISALGVLGSIGLVLTRGLNLGVDFRGGTLIMAATPEPEDISTFRASLTGLDFGEVNVTEVSDDSGEGRHLVLMRLGIAELAWTCRALLAQVELPAADVATLAAGDTVLIEPQPVLLLPGLRKGWHCSTADSNFSSLSLNKSFEMPEIEHDQNLSLDELPVLFQVVLAEKEFTLAELRSLGAGSVVELGRGETEPVRLALNGKLLGTGELVRIEGRLGVRVLGWNQ